MKTFKTIDLYIQVLLIATFIILAIAIRGNTIFIGYFAVGGYQLLSMLVHESTHWFTVRGSTRRYYHNLVYILVACMVLAIFTEYMLFIFYPLLFAAPFMAIGYTWLCFKETFVYLKRPLSVLK